MKIKALLLVIVFGLLITNVNAADDGSRDHIIIKGDTLWDISDSELNEPMLWPRLWHVNPQVENPDLIYPGTRIWIPTREELMRLTKDMPMPEGMVIPTTEPVVEELPLDFPAYEPVPIEPPKPPVEYLVDRKVLLSSGWVSNEYPGIGEVAYADRSRNLFGKSESVFIKTDSNVSVGDQFLTIRKIKEVKHPMTGEKVGYQIRVTGLLEVMSIENNTPKARIIEGFDHVDEGDNVASYTECKLPLRPETARTPDIQGYIIASRMDKAMSHKGEIIYLDKGADDGLEPGDVFSINDNTPTGTLQVIATKPNTSAAIIRDIQQETRIGDAFGKK
jgi:hypothetical protein